MGKVRTAYTVQEKINVLSYAEKHGNRAAGRKYTINEVNIRKWRKQKSELMGMTKTKKANRGAGALYPAIEVAILEYVKERRERGMTLSTFDIHQEALKLAEKQKIPSTFKASQTWVHAFMKRHKLSIRRRKHISQKLPEDFEYNVTEFQRFIIRQRQANGYPLSQIGNADQIPLTFVGNEMNPFTIMLACTADGGKLPPFVVFKRNTMPMGVKWPAGIHVRVQERGRMDQALCYDWLATVWNNRSGAGLHHSLLVLDAFRAHTTPGMKQRMKESCTTTAVIPAGMTSILQPLDVSINKPLKAALGAKWNDWMAGRNHSHTDLERIKEPELEEICSWIVEAWEQLDPNLIVYAFKKCCISNAMDGTEDDIIWEEFVKTSDHQPKEDDEDEEDCDYYTDRTTREMTKEEIDRFFESDDDEEEFEGFEEIDVKFQEIHKQEK